MRRKPLVNPKENFFVYHKENGLTLNDNLSLMTREHTISIEGNLFPSVSLDSQTVETLTKKYKKFFEVADYVELFFDSPYVDETYEYNKEGGKWYLVEQDRGYA